MLPCRSRRVCTLTAPFLLRNCAQGNNDRHRSIVVESRAYMGSFISISDSSSLTCKFRAKQIKFLRKFSINSPITRLIRVSKVVARNTSSNTHVIKFVALRSQTYFNIPQTRSISKLGKGHKTVLFRTAESFDVFAAAIMGNASMENGPKKMIYDLEKNEIAGKHHNLLPS